MSSSKESKGISNLFIKRLVAEEKIKLIQPSEEVCEAYLKKSSKSIISAKTLSSINNLDDATALIYYSMYYALLGLMFRCGIKSENHTGTIILLNQLFEMDSSLIKQAKEERINKQYYIEYEATKDEVLHGIRTAEVFSNNLKMKLNNIKQNEIIAIRNKIKKIKQ